VPPKATAGQPTIDELLADASDLEGVALFQDERIESALKWTVSATGRDQHGATCMRDGDATHCIAFAGYERQGILDALAREASSIPAPPWAIAILDHATKLDGPLDIASHSEGTAGIVLDVHEDTSRFAVKRDGAWRLSGPYDGGRSLRPFYFGAFDLSAAVGEPAIGLALGRYTKEACVRAETDELVVLVTDGDHLAERGRTLLGLADWVAPAGENPFGPFDDRDPNHYAVRLAPRVLPDHRVQLEVAQRHTPTALRGRDTGCGLGVIATAPIDAVLGRVGPHRLAELLAEPRIEE